VNPAAATGSVTFYDGRRVLGIATSVGGQATLTTILLPSGGRALRAYYEGNATFSPSVSPTLSYVVHAVPLTGVAAPASSSTARPSDAAIADSSDPDYWIYADSLVNGWRNYSWAAVDLSATSPIHTGSHSIEVTCGAFEALYMNHNAFDSGSYAAITFWIHGGPTGGQLLQVQGLLAGNPQTAIALQPLAANTWQQIIIPLASLGVANKPNLDGLWIQDATGSAQPPFFVDDIKLTAAPPPSQVHLSVNAINMVRSAGRVGVNSAIWDNVFDSADTISMLTDINNQALRFPGGSSSDDYHWATNTTNNGVFWANSFAQFSNVATSTRATNVFITANYGSGTPAEAADWVNNSNVTHQYGFKYWEIGNENYGSWETDNNPRPHDPYTYAMRFQDYFTQMKAIDPTIKVGAVVITGQDTFVNYMDHPATNPATGQTHNGWTPVLLTTLKSLGVTPDFVAYHRYEQEPGDESDAYLLQSARTWGNDAADLRQQLTDYLGEAGSSVEIVCTENNSVSYNVGKQTTSLVNGLFMADSVGQILQTEFRTLVWWDMRNGQEPANNNSALLYGWRQYGDYGLANYADPAGPADRYPTYYAAKLLQHFASGGDQIVSTASDYGLLSVYGARRNDGSLSLLIINKSPASTLPAAIDISGYASSANAVIYSYGVPQDEAARTGIGSADVTQTAFGEVAASFAYTFPPYSATVISLVSAPPKKRAGQLTSQ
jgi:hypothetical protein